MCLGPVLRENCMLDSLGSLHNYDVSAEAHTSENRQVDTYNGYIFESLEVVKLLVGQWSKYIK